MVKIVLVLVACWLLADFTYSRIVHWRVNRWERSIAWDDDGVRTGCAAFDAGPERAEDAVLMIHGLNDSPACFRELAPALGAEGFFCRAMRLPGFGQSTRAYAAATRDQWTKAIESELQALRRGRRHVFVAAHSLGGALAIELLRQRPQAADKLVLLAPAVEVSDARSPLLSPAAWNRVAGSALIFTRVTASPFGLDAAQIADDDYPFRTPFSPRSIFDQSFAIMADNRGREQELRTPVLLAVSRRDKVIDWEAADRFVRNCGAEVKEVEYFDDTGHALTVDHTWKRLAVRIGKFLRE